MGGGHEKGCVMADRNILDFNQRCKRIDKAFVSGYGFEALGTLGRSHYTRGKKWRIPVMGPVLVLVLSVVVLKAALLHVIGPSTYQMKVDRLWEGAGFEQVGAVVMQADPVTIWLAGKFAEVRF